MQEWGRGANARRVIGLRVGGESRAYPLAAVHEAGVLRDRINGEAVVIESLGEGDSRSVRIVESPAGAQVLHTYWFAWAAMWPETEIVRETADRRNDARKNDATSPKESTP